MADILALIVGLLDAPAKIKQYVINPLKDQVNYLCRYNSNLESLRDNVQRLKNTRANVQQRVDAARNNLETIRPHVVEWLQKVEKTGRDFGAIPEVQQGCADGRCPNLTLRYSVSRKAKKMTNEVNVLVQQGSMFEGVGDRASTPVSIPVASGTFDSRKTIEEDIMAALMDDSVYLIGICGMGGVGKTTMVKKIRERAEKENQFCVAMAVISQQSDPKRIQEEIAGNLGLKLENETESNRTVLLRTRLMKEKNILIIIDDIWEKMNLKELGIPSKSEHKGCKIILTSRDRCVCKEIEALLRDVGTEIEPTEMENKNIFPLKCLDEEEAWALFRAKAGNRVDEPNLHQIAKDVANECKGLPLALVTVGCALANKKAKHDWEDALVQLQRSAPLNISGVLEQVYQPLKLSYNHLKSREARYLFLLCCLFPEDSRISLKALLYYGVGLRIFSKVDTLGEVRNRVYGLVEMLESRYMLMDDGTDEGIRYVKVHDVIRDMAIYIASTGVKKKRKGKHVFMISHDTRVKDWPIKDSCKNYTCISLTLKDDVEIPDCINCARLKMLRMTFYWNAQVPDTFFGKMWKLNVLDIGNITSVPSSLKSLANLRTLRLCGSKMETVSMIGQLVKLEILDLRNCDLQLLPKEIGGLKNLKSLDLSWCYQLTEIAPGVISRLVQLEELFMLNSFKNWEADLEGEKGSNASLVEVASLKDLTALQLHIPNPKVLSQDTLPWPKLERFAICIGKYPLFRREDYDGNNLFLNLSETTPLVHALTRKADNLQLNLGGMGASDEVMKLIEEGNQNLKWLSLDGCDSMKYLVNKSSNENIIFPILGCLSFSNCRDLEVICYGGPPSAGSFHELHKLRLKDLCKLTHMWDQKLCLPNLSQVFIRECNSLQYVFLQSIAESLSQLKLLELQKCSVLKEVFKAESGGSADVVSPIVFPNLTSLWLSELPSLNSFCEAANGIDFRLLETLHIENLDNLKVFCPMEESRPMERGEHSSDSQFLFHQKVTFASLVELKLCNLSIATKIFSSQIPIDSFSQLELLEVEFCPNLKAIFSPPAFKNFRKLNKLIVKTCSKLEEVIGKEDGESQAEIMEPLFPKLKELILSELPNFKKFYHTMNDVELPQLESITIVDCHKMETFSLGSLSLPRLTRVCGWFDPDRATQILLEKETPRHEIHFENNSFTLLARDLSIFDSRQYWERCLEKDSSDNFLLVARLLGCYDFEISERFEMDKLSPGTYEVVFEIMLEESSFQCGGLVNLKLTQPGGITQERSEDLRDQPRGVWIEILAGEFTTGPNPIGELEFTLCDQEFNTDTESIQDSDFFLDDEKMNNPIEGLLVKGVTIRPKA